MWTYDVLLHRLFIYLLHCEEWMVDLDTCGCCLHNDRKYFQYGAFIVLYCYYLFIIYRFSNSKTYQLHLDTHAHTKPHKHLQAIMKLPGKMPNDLTSLCLSGSQRCRLDIERATIMICSIPEAVLYDQINQCDKHGT